MDQRSGIYVRVRVCVDQFACADWQIEWGPVRIEKLTLLLSADAHTAVRPCRVPLTVNFVWKAPVSSSRKVRSFRTNSDWACRCELIDILFVLLKTFLARIRT